MEINTKDFDKEIEKLRMGIVSRIYEFEYIYKQKFKVQIKHELSPEGLSLNIEYNQYIDTDK